MGLFEFRNDWYPDIDDTAMVTLAFPHMKASESAKAQAETKKRAIALAARDAVVGRRMGRVRCG